MNSPAVFPACAGRTGRPPPLECGSKLPLFARAARRLLPTDATYCRAIASQLPSKLPQRKRKQACALQRGPWQHVIDFCRPWQLWGAGLPPLLFFARGPGRCPRLVWARAVGPSRACKAPGNWVIRKSSVLKQALRSARIVGFTIGSSPRVWGAPTGAKLRPSLVRFIPTRVGSTSRHCLRLVREIGSSPRVWGARASHFSGSLR